ncbi:MAG: tetratricopeptide repeat protein [Betaproteobacteria bacterium]|nr:tetratricopeptide repeat protein [Betaproteobacteria bacterium]
MSGRSLTPEGEAAWLRFKQHVEWCESCALVFVFSDFGEVAEIFRARLAAIYRARVSGLELERPRSPAALPERLLPRLLAPGMAERALAAPVWVDLASGRGEEWDQARREFLTRLNERREVLLRSRTRPVILVFPLGFATAVREMAPDLWAIRHYTLNLAPWVGRTAPDFAPPAERAQARPFEFSPDDLRLLEEWRRVRDGTDRGVLRSGWRASAVCRQRGRWAEKGEIDAAVLVVARKLTRLGETPEALRDLSISLDNVGRTHQALGQWEAARAAYQESLEIRRGLLTRLGETPEALRDLSISLDNVGRTHQALGQWEAARAAYQESLEIAEQLATRLPDVGDPLALRDHLRRALASVVEEQAAGGPHG